MSLGVVAAVGLPIAALVAVLVFGGDDDSPGREPYVSPIWVPRSPEDLDRLKGFVCDCVAGVAIANVPIVDADDAIARCAWEAIWPSVPFPSPALEGDHPALAEALARLREAVGRARGAGYCGPAPLPPPRPPAPNPDPGPGPQPSPPPTPTPEHLAPWIAPQPAPGRLYQVVAGDEFFGDAKTGGIVARALHAAVLEAAAASGMTQAKALQLAAVVAADAQARVEYLQAIQCSPWNDALYGTWRHSSAYPGAHGRIVTLTPKHDAVYDRLLDGEAPRRTVHLGKPADVGTTKSPGGVGSRLPLVWLPVLDAEALLDPNRSNPVNADGMSWPNGSSTYDPPPFIANLGIDGAPGQPWGCAA